MFLLGITGAIGSGKSTVTEMFVRRGAERLDADAAGHAALELPDVRELLRNRWGETILSRENDVSSPLSRRAIAAIVFAPTGEGRRELQFLQETTHPKIAILLQERIGQLRARRIPLAVLDAPLLFEAGWDHLVDKVLFVDCPDAVRLERVLARGWSEEEFRVRDARQWAPAEKRRRADWSVSTYPETPEETETQIERIRRRIDFQSGAPLKIQNPEPPEPGV